MIEIKMLIHLIVVLLFYVQDIMGLKQPDKGKHLIRLQKNSAIRSSEIVDLFYSAEILLAEVSDIIVVSMRKINYYFFIGKVKKKRTTFSNLSILRAIFKVLSS